MQLCGLDQTKMYMAGQQNGDICGSSHKIICWQNSLFQRGQSFFLLRLSTDWMESIHITENN